MATDKKTITIVGVTGNQGSSVAKTFVQTPGWHVRGITRSRNGSAAKELASVGVELVEADLDDVETLVTAFKGANVIYGATDFIALTKYPNLPDLLATKYKGLPVNQACYQHELQQGKNVVSAAARTLEDGQLETFVLSTLSDPRRWSKGTHKKLLHFEIKAVIEDYLRAEHPKLAAKTSYLQVGFYMSNLWYPFFMPKKQDDGSFAFRWACINPDTVITANDPPKDVGIFVRALLKAPHGTVLLGESDPMTVQQLVELWGQVTGTKTKLIILGKDEGIREIDAVMPTFGEEFVENSEYYRDFGYDGGDPAVKRPADLGIQKSDLTSFRSYLERQDWTSVVNV